MCTFYLFGSTAYILDDVDKCPSKCLLVLAFEFAILVWIPSFCPSVGLSFRRDSCSVLHEVHTFIAWLQSPSFVPECLLHCPRSYVFTRLSPAGHIYFLYFLVRGLFRDGAYSGAGLI